MSTLLTVAGRDVLFLHWPVDPDDLASVVPDGLAVETFDGSAWVSVLALENVAVAPGSLDPPRSARRGVPQVNLRTYVRADDDPGVYFLSLDTGSALAAATARRGFGLPFHHARARLTRRDGTVTVRSDRAGDGDGGRRAAFAARYRQAAEPEQAPPRSLAAFCVERTRYVLPGAEARATGALWARAGENATYVGRIDREPWAIGAAAVTVETNTLFAAAGLDPPAATPVTHYSPGFEMAVVPPERHETT